jgi:soluble lytic murein transglycosylase-like protein
VSVAAVESAGAVTAAVGAHAAIARIAELQALVARATGAEPASAASNGGASFASTLAAAGGQQVASVAAGAFQPAAAGFGVTAPASSGLGSTGLGAPSPFDGLIVSAAQRYGIDPALLKGLIRAESNFDPNASSGAGAAGLVQLMPGTAASLGVTDRLDPAQSIDGGARYLRQQLDAFGGDVTKALAAYNAGPGAVRRFGGVPPYAETQAYVQKVLAYADEYRSAGGTNAYGALPPTTGSGSIT